MTGNLVSINQKWLFAILPGLLLVAGGCTQEPYVSGYSFYPQPAVVQVRRTGGGEQAPLTVLASIEGLLRGDPERHTPPSVEVRLQVENNGPSRVTFDPNTLMLVTGTLRPFPPPHVEPPTVLELNAGQRQDVTAYFPLPPGANPNQMNLTNLRLRWQVGIDNYTVPQTALFEQRATSGNNYNYNYSQGPDVAY